MHFPNLPVTNCPRTKSNQAVAVVCVFLPCVSTAISCVGTLGRFFHKKYTNLTPILPSYPNFPPAPRESQRGTGISRQRCSLRKPARPRISHRGLRDPQGKAFRPAVGSVWFCCFFLNQINSRSFFLNRQMRSWMRRSTLKSLRFVKNGSANFLQRHNFRSISMN